MEESQLSLTAAQHHMLLSKRQKIEETFMVKINSPGFEQLVSAEANSEEVPAEYRNFPDLSPSHDIFIIAIVGEGDSIKTAKKYITALIFPQLIHLFSYEKKLEIIFGSSLWNEMIEVIYCVCISKGGDLELIISGNETDVALAVSCMQHLVEQCGMCDKTETDIEKHRAIQQLSDDLKRYKNIDIQPHLYNKLHIAVIGILLTWLKQVFEAVLPEGDSCLILEGVDASVIIIDSDDESKTNFQGKSCGKRSLFGSGHASNEEIEVVKEVKKRKTPPPPAFDFIPLNTNCQNTRQVCQPAPPCIPADKTSAANQLQQANSIPRGPRQLRPIVIDGSNVARAHGKPKKVFSCRGIAISIEYFLERGHHSVTAFVPQYRRHNSFDIQATDQGILEMLADKQLVVFTPSRRVGTKRISSYDDRFIVDLAFRIGGVIVSNDNFRDIMEENEDWKTTIEERLLMYCFVGDIFMIPQDPLGKNGPRLDDFLAFRDT